MVEVCNMCLEQENLLNRCECPMDETNIDRDYVLNELSSYSEDDNQVRKLFIIQKLEIIVAVKYITDVTFEFFMIMTFR